MQNTCKGLLAGAGILGLAVGFGAQSLVKDIISGFFVIFEDQFSVGDYIKINTFEGEVLEIGLRTTKLKSKTGRVTCYSKWKYYSGYQFFYFK